MFGDGRVRCMTLPIYYQKLDTEMQMTFVIFLSKNWGSHGAFVWGPFPFSSDDHLTCSNIHCLHCHSKQREVGFDLSKIQT